MQSDSKKVQPLPKTRPHPMVLNFNSRKTDRSEISSPPGYSSTSQVAGESVKKIDQKLLNRKSWETALAPFKQGFMNLFVMYMAGNSISIFPIMLIVMLFIKPINAIISISSGNLCTIGLALFKCQSMGLLPTHSSDWLDFLEYPQRIEYSGGGISM